jgi:hypothetical protein
VTEIRGRFKCLKSCQFISSAIKHDNAANFGHNLGVTAANSPIIARNRVEALSQSHQAVMFCRVKRRARQIFTAVFGQ